MNNRSTIQKRPQIGQILWQSFTRKERDEETGYGYFGARYYNADLLNSWMSVDPMCDKYPSVRPYAYCGWNPIRIFDPDGRDWYRVIDEDGKEEYRWAKSHKDAMSHKNENGFKKINDKMFSANGKYFSLFGGIYEDNTEECKMIKKIDEACQNYAFAKKNNKVSVQTDFSTIRNFSRRKHLPTTFENVLEYKFKSAASSGIGTGKIVLLLNENKNGIEMSGELNATSKYDYSKKYFGGDLFSKGHNYYGYIVKFGRQNKSPFALIIFKNEKQYDAFFNTLNRLYSIER